MSTAPKKFYTPEEYLDLEAVSEIKHEFYQGEIFAMVGASRAHNEIARNLFARLFNQLEARDCKAHGSDTMVKIQASGFYTYPDITIACKPFHYDKTRLETILNPRVIMEVLSPSTEDHDLGFKWKQYRQIPSLQEVLFFSQSEPLVDHYIRDGEEWRLISRSGLESIVEFPSINCTIPMNLIYADVDFSTAERREIPAGPNSTRA